MSKPDCDESRELNSKKVQAANQKMRANIKREEGKEMQFRGIRYGKEVELKYGKPLLKTKAEEDPVRGLIFLEEPPKLSRKLQVYVSEDQWKRIWNLLRVYASGHDDKGRKKYIPRDSLIIQFAMSYGRSFSPDDFLGAHPRTVINSLVEWVDFWTCPVGTVWVTLRKEPREDPLQYELAQMNRETKPHSWRDKGERPFFWRIEDADSWFTEFYEDLVTRFPEGAQVDLVIPLTNNESDGNRAKGTTKDRIIRGEFDKYIEYEKRAPTLEMIHPKMVFELGWNEKFLKNRLYLRKEWLKQKAEFEAKGVEITRMDQEVDFEKLMEWDKKCAEKKDKIPDLNLPEKVVSVYREILLDLLEEYEGGVLCHNLKRDLNCRVSVLSDPDVPELRGGLFPVILHYVPEAEIKTVNTFKWARLLKFRGRGWCKMFCDDFDKYYTEIDEGLQELAEVEGHDENELHSVIAGYRKKEKDEKKGNAEVKDRVVELKQKSEDDPNMENVKGALDILRISAEKAKPQSQGVLLSALPRLYKLKHLMKMKNDLTEKELRSVEEIVKTRGVSGCSTEEVPESSDMRIVRRDLAAQY